MASTAPNPFAPEAFSFGVATSAFQVEGGLNGPGQPHNHWQVAEATGKVARSGVAAGFYEHPELLLDAAGTLGVDAMRISVEWARVEREPGMLDEEAIARYVALVADMASRGLEPVVTLHHFTHPAFLGPEFWLMPGSPERFMAFAGPMVEALAPHVRRFVTINEPQVEALHGWVTGLWPPFRRGALADALCVVDNLLVAHLLAAKAIKAARPDAQVTLTQTSSSAYDLSALYLDLLELPNHAPAGNPSAWFAARRRSFEASGMSAGKLESALRWAAAAASGYGDPGALELDPTSASGKLGALLARPGTKRALAMVLEDGAASLDAIALDHYDPRLSRSLRQPWREVGGERRVWPFPDHDEWVHDPAELFASLRQLGALHPGRPIVLMEHGMATKRERGRAVPRADGLTRPRFLAEQLSALAASMDAGLPVTGYLHWSLVDNYEWGSYAPRFGLFGMDRPRGDEVPALMATDAAGEASAAAYAAIIKGLRTGDRSVLDAYR